MDSLLRMECSTSSNVNFGNCAAKEKNFEFSESEIFSA